MRVRPPLTGESTRCRVLKATRVALRAAGLGVSNAPLAVAAGYAFARRRRQTLTSR